MFNHQRHSRKLLITSIFLFILMLAFLIAFIVELNKEKSSDKDENVTQDCETSDANFTVCYSQDCQASGKFIKEAIDFSVKPCVDFYKYACGNWLRENPIPDSEMQHGIFQSIGVKVNDKVKGLLNQPNSSATPAEDKARIFYQSCMYDDPSVEQTSIKEINEILAKLGGWPIIMDKWTDDGKRQWWEAVATVKNDIGLDVILGVLVAPNFLNTAKYSIFMQLPQPDMLHVGLMSVPHPVFNATEKPDIAAAYRQYFMEIVCHFTSGPICRSESTKAEIEKILALEGAFQMAARQANLMHNLIPKGVVLGDTVFHSPNLRSDDNDVSSFIMKVKDLNAKVAGVEWEKFLRIILNDSQIDSIAELEVMAITPILQILIDIVNTQSKQTIANYIGFKVVEHLNPYASPRLRKIQFDFNSKVFGVQAETKPDDACVALATSTMGFAVTSLYAAAYIGAADIEHAKNLITNIRIGFLHTFTENAWLDKTTKEKAIKKLNMMEENVGFPLWNNDTKLVNEYYQKLPQFSEKEFLKNALSAMKVNFLNSFAKLKGPVDRKNAWPVKNPLVLNAFYYVNLNSFYLVAGVMELPILSKNNLESLNYGGIGYIIGHEVMHGFDDKGAHFDEMGQFSNWWSVQSQTAFAERKNCMSKQYNVALDEVPSLTVNGQLTLGENIADNGGIKGSYWGYKAAVKEDIRLPGIEFISGDRLFFISAAQLWCTNTRPEAAANFIESDTHSPAKFRVNIPFGNSVEFLNAFKCNKNTEMNFGNKCVIF